MELRRPSTGSSTRNDAVKDLPKEVIQAGLPVSPATLLLLGPLFPLLVFPLPWRILMLVLVIVDVGPIRLHFQGHMLSKAHS